MTSVLFVCMGNICRSPAAEGVFRKFVEDAGRTHEFEIDSAGTHGYHTGDRADPRMRSAAAQRGFELGSRARRVHPEDFDRFDYIVSMDEDNYEILTAQHNGGRARIVRMCSFSSNDNYTEVPDPYYGGEAGFYTVLDILEDACANLLKQL